jgi:hypothetical protein
LGGLVVPKGREKMRRVSAKVTSAKFADNCPLMFVEARGPGRKRERKRMRKPMLMPVSKEKTKRTS